MTKKQRFKAEELNKEADKWLKCRAEKCDGYCATCEYNLDLSMVDLLSGYKNLLENILNGKDSKRTKAK